MGGGGGGAEGGRCCCAVDAGHAASATQTARHAAGTGGAPTATACLHRVKGGDGDTMQNCGIVCSQLLIPRDAPARPDLL